MHLHLLLPLLTVDASAYSLQTNEAGDHVRWPDFPVRYRVDTSGGAPVDHPEQVAADAFAAWEGAPDLDVAFRTTRNADNVVWFTEDWPHDPELLALTSSWSDVEGTLVSFEIRVNANLPWGTNGEDGAYDLQAVLTHEVGHALGIEHSEVEQAAMFATMGQGDTSRREIHDDDRAALSFLYAREDAPLDTADPNGIPSACSTGGSASGAWTLLGVLVLARRSHRRP